MTAARASFTDVYSAALRGERCHVVSVGGGAHPLPVAHWVRPVDAGDVAVLDRCVGATLDIGCGPGRMSAHLTERGHPVLGLDLVPEAVSQTRERGAAALLRDVFDPLPGEGRWETALLADGNIGIGGDPVALLARTVELLRRSGRVVVDLAGPGVDAETRWIRLETGSQRSRPFAWSVVGVDAIADLGARVGLEVGELAHHADRWFAVLRRSAR